VSIGVAFCPDHGSDSHDLLRCADVAMYLAKHAASGVAAYRRQLDHHTPERLALMSDLGTAIRENQLRLVYQPIVSLRDRRLIGFEALVRWLHPAMGLVRPTRFIPLAEMSDLIHPLTDWVADHALDQLRRWHDEGLDLSIALNLSTRNLLNQGWASRMQRLIERHGVRPERVELEITETALISDPERALELLEHMASLGVRISIDDFGTGYSSLSYLKRLPVSTLKIDRGFVRDMTSDEQDRVIVRSTIKLAQSLGLQVLAEGVESQDILDELEAFDCDRAQGFHIARPMPPTTVTDWVKRNGEWTPRIAAQPERQDLLSLGVA
jgi:EAL domain-containing protein (putative c-di-GMP-specific phosphodiesterase class I)